MTQPSPARSVGFALFLGSTVALFWTPLGVLIRLALQQEQYSHILLVPLVSAFLFYRERERVFSHVETQWRVGLGVVLGGALVYLVGQRHSVSLSENDRLSIAILSVVLTWIGGFALCYGISALRVGLFPGLFLLLMVPIPDFFLNRVIFWLQTGSAEVSYAAFRLLDVPIFRTGFIFALPGVTIEVAKECSGIRSSLAMFITTLLAGHLFLQSPWKKTILVLATLPLLVVKNGIRIVTLSLLSVYVDPGFLTGSLHQQGGILFFLIALALLAPVLAFLQRAERAQGRVRPG